jgi:putative methionine-R-sulfoxide reductase with GAF domain/GGDEF domain-containing protein
VQSATQIAILGGGEEELNLLSEFHRTKGIEILGIYDRDPRALAMEIAEIIGVPTFCDDSFLPVFGGADYIVVTEKRKSFEREITLLTRERKKIINPSEAVNYLASGSAITAGEGDEAYKWPLHLEEALKYLNRITDRERLLKWLLEISVRAVGASAGSIMLYSEHSQELYIAYATGLSSRVVQKTRQRIGVGIAGQVAETKEARLLDDIVDTPLYKDGRERQKIKSAISAPLDHEGRLLGVVNISTNEGEKKLERDDVKTIEMLAAKITPILEQHLRIDSHEIREIEFQIRGYLETLFHKDIGFHDKFTYLSSFLVEKLGADTVTVYTATDEGDWLILGGSDQQLTVGSHATRIHCIKGSLARAYLSKEEVIMTEVRHEIGLKFKPHEEGIASVYIPLVHTEPLGVIHFEFSDRERLEKFLRMKDTLRFQVGFFTYSQLRELRQSRRMESLEDLSSITPVLVTMKDMKSKITHLPVLLSSLVKASMGSLHHSTTEGWEESYYHFPGEEPERSLYREYDQEILERVMANWEPLALSFMPAEVGMSEEPPIHHSIIAYPLFKSDDTKGIYIGYNKIPSSPLDSSVFGGYEMNLLCKVGEILVPLLAEGEEDMKGEGYMSFSDLLKSNQKMLIERIRDEIERAERYHHSFTVTLFRIFGLKEILDDDYKGGLALINELSLGIRKQVRKTDYFSWIEADLFGVLSLESYQRIGFLEERLSSYIREVLADKSYTDPETCYPVSGYSLFPGAQETPADIIHEAKARIDKQLKP